MNSSERHIEAMESLAQQERARQQNFGETGGPSGMTGGFGQGIGNLSGWAIFFGMVGAVLGGLLGRGLLGATVGAVLFGGAMWALGALGRSSGGGVSRRSVVFWALTGAAGGAVLGTLLGSEDARHMVNAAFNWSIFGAILFGGVRLVRRARK